MSLKTIAMLKMKLLAAGCIVLGIVLPSVLSAISVLLGIELLLIIKSK